jgi:hypothetical protein
MEILKFLDIELKRIPVQVGDRWFILQEASEGATVRWRNGMMASARIRPDGSPERMDGLADIEPQLVADCMFYATVKEGVTEVKYVGDLNIGKQVALSLVLSWPHEIIPPMYEWIMTTSGLKDLFSKAEEVGEKELAALGMKEGELASTSVTITPTDLGNLQSS